MSRTGILPSSLRSSCRYEGPLSDGGKDSHLHLPIAVILSGSLVPNPLKPFDYSSAVTGEIQAHDVVTF
jgi:hypothetical protein